LGVEITNRCIRALAGYACIEVEPMGTAKRQIPDGASTTLSELNGSTIQLIKDVEVCASPQSEGINRRTAERLDLVTGDGVIWAPRKKID